MAFVVFCVLGLKLQFLNCYRKITNGVSNVMVRKCNDEYSNVHEDEGPTSHARE